MKTVAIIPAGGAGKRMGGGVPKQYLPLAGVPVIVRTLQAFQSSPLIDEIYLVVPEGDIPAVRQEIVLKNGLSKVGMVIAGGVERHNSVKNALLHVRDEHEIILVHDGVRPFVSADLIRNVVSAAVAYGAATAGIPVRDTVKQVSADGSIMKTVSREGLWLTQTPQAFQRPIILAGYEKAVREGFSGTDDASVVERTGAVVRMILGDDDNIKLTAPEDLVRGEAILCRRAEATKG